MNKQELLQKGRANIIELCQLYSAYAIQDRFKNSYLHAVDDEGTFLNIESRMSMSAFIDIEVLGADPDNVAYMYGRSPTLEGGDILAKKLYAYHDEYILDILSGYDRYICDFDEYCKDVCPVCLDEYLDTDYWSDLIDVIFKQIDSQFAVFEACLMEEGVTAMRERNADVLFIAGRFMEQLNSFYEDFFCLSDEYKRTLKSIASLVREDALLPKILSWSEGRNIRRAVDSGTFPEMFNSFCEDIAK